MNTDYQSLYQQLLADPRLQRNLDWGEPRHGHPEGPVREHVAEVERNIEALRPRLASDEQYWKLRVLALVHDAFKAEAGDVAILDPASHASLARAFLAERCADPDLLAIVQFHDMPYALWRREQHTGHCPVERFEALLTAIHDWDLFLAFCIADGSTGGKGRDPLRWGLRKIGARVPTRFTEADVL